MAEPPPSTGMRDGDSDEVAPSNINERTDSPYAPPAVNIQVGLGVRSEVAEAPAIPLVAEPPHTSDMGGDGGDGVQQTDDATAPSPAPAPAPTPVTVAAAAQEAALGLRSQSNDVEVGTLVSADSHTDLVDAGALDGDTDTDGDRTAEYANQIKLLPTDDDDDVGRGGATAADRPQEQTVVADTQLYAGPAVAAAAAFRARAGQAGREPDDVHNKTSAYTHHESEAPLEPSRATQTTDPEAQPAGTHPANHDTSHADGTQALAPSADDESTEAVHALEAAGLLTTAEAVANPSQPEASRLDQAQAYGKAYHDIAENVEMAAAEVASPSRDKQAGAVHAVEAAGFMSPEESSAQPDYAAVAPGIEQEGFAEDVTHGHNGVGAVPHDTAVIQPEPDSESPQDRAHRSAAATADVSVETAVPVLTAECAPNDGSTSTVVPAPAPAPESATATSQADALHAVESQSVEPVEAPHGVQATDLTASTDQPGKPSAGASTANGEEDLEQRWKALAFEDSTLLDDLLSEDDDETDAVEAAPTPERPDPLLESAEVVPQSTDITAAYAYTPVRQSPPQPQIPGQPYPPGRSPPPVRPQSQPQPAQPPTRLRSPLNPYIPQTAQPPQRNLAAPGSAATISPYAPPNPYLPRQVASSVNLRDTYAPAAPFAPPPLFGPSAAASAGIPTVSPALQRRPPLPTQEQGQSQLKTVHSFVDKSKGGYQSPYDLPMEFTKPLSRHVPAPPTVPQPMPRALPQGQRQPLSQTQQQSQPVRKPPATYTSVPPPPPSQRQVTPKPQFAPPPPPSAPRRPSSASASALGTAALAPAAVATNAGQYVPSAASHTNVVSAAAAARARTPEASSVLGSTGFQYASPPALAPRSQMSPSPRLPAQPIASTHGVYAGATPPAPASAPFSPPRRPPSEASQPQHADRDEHLSLASSRLRQVQGSAARHSPLSQRRTPTPEIHPPAPVPLPAFTEPDYIIPSDGQELDPLQRWKGAPVFKSGFGGTVVLTVPKLMPKYLAGHITPKMKPTPGPVQTKKLADIIPHLATGEQMDTFPGPLVSKSKKKDVTDWMTRCIERMEAESRENEDVMLWKLLRLIVEHDGITSWTPAIVDAVCAMIGPSTTEPPAFPAVTTDQPPTAPDVLAKTKALSNMRSHLIEGSREKAVWEAADNMLWGHALLLASSIEDKTTWRRVIEEFVRKELAAMPDAQSLAALYQVLAGNAVECVDQLVPPSTRAGLHMMHRSGAETRTAVADGLGKWRETVVLILRNMSVEGPRALIEIAQLLASFGRVSAAHTCLLLAKSLGAPVCFASQDDPQSAICLLSWDHRRQSLPAGGNLTATVLTEVYEFATTVLGSRPAATELSYLHAYKLLHAEHLAESGDHARALEYCDAFATTLKKAGSKPSLHLHSLLVARWEELSERLTSLSPTGAGTWMSRPKMSRVSSSVWAKFNSFVAGEDTDESPSSTPRRSLELNVLSNASPQVVTTPPANILHVQQQQLASQPLYPGYTPQPRRSPAPAMHSSQPPIARVASASRLAQYNPTAYAPQGHQLHSLDKVMEVPTATNAAASRYAPQTPSANEYAMSPLSLQNTPQTAVGGPLPAVQETQGENIAPHASNSHQPSVMEPSPQVTAASVSQESAPGGGRLSHLRQMIFPGVAADGETVVASSPSPAPGSTGYMPPDVDAQSSPATSSDSDAASVKDKKKRAAILEDDAEFDAALMKRAAAFQKSEEKRKAKEAAQATEEASSSNAKAAQNGPPKKGWFLGWFGGGGGAKKDSAQPGKAIRAKLGEENSFYYDKELKRWVNRKDPNSTANAAAAVPPPPMARPMAASRQPSYVGSAATPPPPTSRTPTVQTPGSAPAMPASMADARLPQPRLADTVTMSVPTLRPDDVAAELGPSADNRPPAANAASAPLLPTKAQNADTLDDLLGGAPAPVPRVHTTARNKRKGRGYVDLMAK